MLSPTNRENISTNLDTFNDSAISDLRNELDSASKLPNTSD